MNESPLVFLRRTEVERRTCLGKSAIYGLMKQGKFPAPYRVGEGSISARVAWLEHEVEQWIATRVAMTIADRQAGKALPNGAPQWRKPRTEWAPRKTAKTRR